MAKIPVIHSLPAKTILPDDHPYSIGNLGKIGTKHIYQTMQEADLLNHNLQTIHMWITYLIILKQSEIANPKNIGNSF